MYENAIEVLKILEKNNYQAYIVGGFPRDLYLKKKSRAHAFAMSTIQIYIIRINLQVSS